MRDTKRTKQLTRQAAKIGYNSHGAWSTLGEIREQELDRGNRFPRPGLPADTPAIWVTYVPRFALRYVALADDWRRITEGKLTKAEKDQLSDLTKIRIRDCDKIVEDDGDDGYLLVRPKTCKR